MHCANIETQTTGIILAGGKSTRMGSNKALLYYKNKRLIDHAMSLLEQTGIKDIIVSGKISGYHCVPDITPHQGPLGGINSTMLQIGNKSKQLLFIPVDMPLLTSNTTRHLLQNLHDFDAVFYEHCPLPLVINFTSSIQIKLTKQLKERPEGGSIKDFLSNLHVTTLRHPDHIILELLNINTQKDYSQLPD